MSKNIWKLAMLGWAALSLCIVPATAFGEERHEYGHTHEAQESGKHKKDHGSSALVEEMVVLDRVFRDVVSAVALGDGTTVRSALTSMHGTMEKTHEAVHVGTVSLRKNPGRLKEFVELDKTFHARLESLTHAAKKNDQNAMLSLTKELLDRCVGCHREFR